MDEVIALDSENRSCKQEADNLRAQRNKISKQIGGLMAQGKKEEAEELKQQVNRDSEKLQQLEAKEIELNDYENYDGDSQYHRSICSDWKR